MKYVTGCLWIMQIFELRQTAFHKIPFSGIVVI
jgi:hypothetical protein